MIHNCGSFRMFDTLLTDGLQRIRIDQRTERKLLVGCAPEHLLHSFQLQPLARRCFAWKDAEAAYALLRQLRHRLIGSGAVPVHDCYTPKYFRMAANDI